MGPTEENELGIVASHTCTVVHKATGITEIVLDKLPGNLVRLTLNLKP